MYYMFPTNRLKKLWKTLLKRTTVCTILFVSNCSVSTLLSDEVLRECVEKNAAETYRVLGEILIDIPKKGEVTISIL
jgi:hypothetical protein